MALSDMSSENPHIISTCAQHSSGNGRECSPCVDSENYSTNTLEQSVTITGGS